MGKSVVKKTLSIKVPKAASKTFSVKVPKAASKSLQEGTR